MKRHSPDLVSLVFGLVFLLVATLWPLWQLGLLDGDSITWVPATALIAIGLLGLTVSIARSRTPADGPAPAADDAAYGGPPIDSSAPWADTADEPTRPTDNWPDGADGSR